MAPQSPYAPGEEPDARLPRDPDVPDDPPPQDGDSYEDEIRQLRSKRTGRYVPRPR